ncbi:MAG: hypothetical protein JRH16_02335 [Deltaproteobacteria bacterium]|nr:hypothetical protein [Deltaproteobacteria bacterium]MBW2360571.1 hypothetical protein [Deltaproteobacteria bacterium]
MTIQAFIVSLIGLAILCVGLAGVVSPAGLIALVSNWRPAWRIPIAAALRIVFGVALWLAALDSHAPAALRALGALSFAAGLALPFVGRARVDALIDWWTQRSAGTIRCWAGVAALLGGFSIWAVLP